MQNVFELPRARKLPITFSLTLTGRTCVRLGCCQTGRSSPWGTVSSARLRLAHRSQASKLTRTGVPATARSWRSIAAPIRRRVGHHIGPLGASNPMSGTQSIGLSSFLRGLVTSFLTIAACFNSCWFSRLCFVCFAWLILSRLVCVGRFSKC